MYYIYITDEDSGENGRVSCVLNDTRLNLIYLTLNAYSLQISGLPLLDYEVEQRMNIELKCTDYGLPSLSKTVLFHIELEDCNDNPPDILSPLPFNQTVFIPFETTETPYIITQFILNDRDRFQSNIFDYAFTVTPSLDLSLTNNGTLILRSMPLMMGLYTINVTVADRGNLTNSISIPIEIHSINETMLIKRFTLENTSLVLILSIFVMIFMASIFIGLCFLLAFVFRRKSNRSRCFCCFNSSHKSARNSSCESMNSSNERADSSQKTTIEVLDDGRVSRAVLSFFSSNVSSILSIDTERRFFYCLDRSSVNRCTSFVQGLMIVCYIELSNSFVFLLLFRDDQPPLYFFFVRIHPIVFINMELNKRMI